MDLFYEPSKIRQLQHWTKFTEALLVCLSLENVK